MESIGEKPIADKADTLYIAQKEQAANLPLISDYAMTYSRYPNPLDVYNQGLKVVAQ